MLRRARRLAVGARRRRLLCAQRAGAGPRQDRRAGGARIRRRAAERAGRARPAARHACRGRQPALSRHRRRSTRRRSSASARCCASRRAASGKAEAIVDKMVEGRLRKFYEEVVLLEQIFVIDGETRVAKVVEAAAKEAGAPVRSPASSASRSARASSGRPPISPPRSRPSSSTERAVRASMPASPDERSGWIG